MLSQDPTDQRATTGDSSSILDTSTNEQMPYKDKAKQLEYQRQWIDDRRAKYTDGKTCVGCGTEDNLQWHHKDPEQKVSHRIWSWSEDRIREELKKCETRCPSCHGSVHRTSPCGTFARYKTGCRCLECKAANAEHSRKQRRRKIGLVV